MNDLDLQVFAGLFQELFLRCFGHELKEPMTETESKLLHNKVFEQTGLTIGWKSIKNYSFFLLSDAYAKDENPSVATLDTMARYVLDAPYTTEPDRKDLEGHYPYWFRYREQFVRSNKGSDEVQAARQVSGTRRTFSDKRKRLLFIFPGIFVPILAAGLVLLFRGAGNPPTFVDNFRTASLETDSLIARGWTVHAIDSGYWEKRKQSSAGLSLFTLKGDNWPDPAERPVIHNLLLRKIPCDCWTLELHLKNFIPRQNWQQAGVLLLEDTAIAGKSLRISIAYNDYSGGYPRSRSVLVQAITSLGNGLGKPEEIAHIPLFNVDSFERNPVLSANLLHAALRIEKQADRFRILYAGGALENASFKEIANHVFAFSPRYAGLFAIKGFVDSSENIPVLFTFFRLNCDRCDGH